MPLYCLSGHSMSLCSAMSSQPAPAAQQRPLLGSAARGRGAQVAALVAEVAELRAAVRRGEERETALRAALAAAQGGCCRRCCAQLEQQEAAAPSLSSPPCAPCPPPPLTAAAAGGGHSAPGRDPPLPRTASPPAPRPPRGAAVTALPQGARSTPSPRAAMRSLPPPPLPQQQQGVQLRVPPPPRVREAGGPGGHPRPPAVPAAAPQGARAACCGGGRAGQLPRWMVVLRTRAARLGSTVQRRVQTGVQRLRGATRSPQEREERAPLCRTPSPAAGRPSFSSPDTAYHSARSRERSWPRDGAVRGRELQERSEGALRGRAYRNWAAWAAATVRRRRLQRLGLRVLGVRLQEQQRARRLELYRRWRRCPRLGGSRPAQSAASAAGMGGGGAFVQCCSTGDGDGTAVATRRRRAPEETMQFVLGIEAIGHKVANWAPDVFMRVCRCTAEAACLVSGLRALVWMVASRHLKRDFQRITMVELQREADQLRLAYLTQVGPEVGMRVPERRLLRHMDVQLCILRDFELRIADAADETLNATSCMLQQREVLVEVLRGGG
eukprot:TRINITY_DN13832_c0_g1_i2.p1 TRINITY_DN13832_c0_g1~~TRINITY_DN13832_c0_g1_i2.p1  ORF type:complete len:554 (+),score=125.83 TRINITY_DN13832_c0_g1_i2:45-1706(+)